MTLADRQRRDQAVSTYEGVGDIPSDRGLPVLAVARKASGGERVVEFNIEHGVPDIVRFVQRPTVMRGGETMGTVRAA